jgi:hypothetical protein
MSGFVLPSDETVGSSDRVQLAEFRDGVKTYGAALVTDPVANKEAIREASRVLGLIKERFAVIETEEAEAAALAASVAEFSVTESSVESRIVIDQKSDPVVASSAPVKSEFTYRTTSAYTPSYAGSVKHSDLGHAFIEAWRGLSGSNPSGRDKHVLFSVDNAPMNKQVWGKDASANFSSWTDVVAPSAIAAADGTTDSIVASGGYCAPLTLSSYEIPYYKELCSTLEDIFPSVQADRGGIMFMRPPTVDTLAEAAAGIAVITAAEDAAGYDCEVPAGPTPCKPCTRISCPTTDSCGLDMITQCIQFGNLNYKTFPEYVDYAMKEMAVAFNRAKRQYLLDKLNDPLNVVAVTGSPIKYGLHYDLASDLSVLKARYNAEYSLCEGSGNLTILLPDWAKPLFMLDMVAREGGLAEYGSISESDVASWFSNLGYNVRWYSGSATGEGQELAPQAAGVVAPFPSKIVAYIFSPGDFVILRNGTIDFGLVRDSKLNHANNLEMMSEEFIGFCRVGRKAIKFTANVCANGLFSRGVDALACAGAGTVE